MSRTQAHAFGFLVLAIGCYALSIPGAERFVWAAIATQVLAGMIEDLKR